MSNPFLRNKQQTAATQQPAAFSNPMPPRTTGVSAFSAPPTAFQSPVQPFTPGVQGTRGIAPPPTMGTAPPQMSNMGMPSAPPTTNVMAPPPTGSVQGSYLATKGRYQVPSNAYQFGSAMQPSQPQNMYAAEVHSESQIAPAYIGNTTTYASTAPAPAPVDASMIPDEEYMKLTYEVAPNSNSLQGLCSMPFGAIFRPMAADGVCVFVAFDCRVIFPSCLSVPSPFSVVVVAAYILILLCSSQTMVITGSATCAAA